MRGPSPGAPTDVHSMAPSQPFYPIVRPLIQPASPLHFTPLPTSMPFTFDIAPALQAVAPAPPAAAAAPTLARPSEPAVATSTGSSTIPAKRGYKSHVPSACVNCKKAHLACDVSRPCKRCVSLGKADTCYDIKHKKRGRPRLRDKQSSNRSDYEIMCGTIHTPTFATQQQSPLPCIVSAPEPVVPFAPPPQPLSSPAALTHMLPTAAASPGHDELLRQALDLDGLQLPFDELTFSGDALMHDYMMAFDEMLPLENAGAYAPLPVSTHATATTATDTDTQHPVGADSSSSNAVLVDERDPAMATLVLSMDVCCARVSEQVTDLWGYYPQELAHRSLYDFVSSHDAERLAKLHRLLLDNVADTACQRLLPETQRTTSDAFHAATLEQLAIAARGADTFTDTLRIKKRSGNEDELFQVAVSVGGGLGADLTQPASLSKLYILAQLRKLPSSASSSSITSTTTTSIPPSRAKTLSARFSPSAGRIRQAAAPPYTPSLPPPPKVNIAPTHGLAIRPTFNHPSSASSPRLTRASASIGGTHVTHPTTQYFLQTSSSMLNAAASAAQSRNRCMSQPLLMAADSNNKAIGAVDSKRTLEMNIRSLLC